ncbi:MAG: plastocyanin/azurin family copper-binding protein [Actinomycetota bacterium]|nr:plastocyanin/azurin family copper-binding protein [Actinomycetota bacterium]
MRAKPLAVLAAAVALVAGASAPAHAAVAAAGPGGFLTGFATPVVVSAPGEAISFTNGDIAPHNFVADGIFLPRKEAKKARWCTSFTATSCPLFWSPTITAGETADVEGVERLESGKQYPFYCTVHPGMKGTLVIR